MTLNPPAKGTTTYKFRINVSFKSNIRCKAAAREILLDLPNVVVFA